MCGAYVGFGFALEASPACAPCGGAIPDAHGAMAHARVPSHEQPLGNAHVLWMAMSDWTMYDRRNMSDAWI